MPRIVAGGSAEGLRYRLTAERVQTAFDDGLSGPELLRFLEERSSKPVPRRVRLRIERWWASYGSVRLYDELSLVVLSEEILPAEVLAAVPALRRHLVYAISPRLLAVEPTAAEAVVAELARLELHACEAGDGRVGAAGLVFSSMPGNYAAAVDLASPGQRLFIPGGVLEHVPPIPLPIGLSDPRAEIAPSNPAALMRDVYTI